MRKNLNTFLARCVSTIRGPGYALEKSAFSGLPSLKKPFLVLGIETSCDDTAAAVVRSDGQILSNVVLSQHKIHQEFGGVVPGLAMKSHEDKIDEVVEKAISDAGLSCADELDAIAVTRGPGLEICLRVGLNKAQDLARKFAKPFVAIHHLEAHCLISRIALEECFPGNPMKPTYLPSQLPHFVPKVQFPFLTLLVSGGHTSILLCHDVGKYDILGMTVDDALGEALDKGARLLGLNASFNGGGAAVEAAASKGTVTDSTELTVPLLRQRNCNFSYSGLKNAFRIAVMREREKHCPSNLVNASNAPVHPREAVDAQEVATLPDNVTANLCAGIQQAAFRHVEDRLYRAIGFVEDYDLGINSLVVCGGVAANKDLRRRIKNIINTCNSSNTAAPNDDDNGWNAFFPPANLCTDNGVMVAWAGVELFCRGMSSPLTDSNESMQPIPRWPLGPNLDENENIKFRKRIRIK